MSSQEVTPKRVAEIRDEDHECAHCGGDGWDPYHTGLSVEGAKCNSCENTGKDPRVRDLLAALRRVGEILEEMPREKSLTEANRMVAEARALCRAAGEGDS